MKHICLTHHHQRKVGELAGEDVGFGGEVELGEGADVFEVVEC